MLACCHDSSSQAICHARTQAGHELFGVGRESIDLTFGGVTIVTAVVATLLGGWALDRVGSSIKNAMLLNGKRLCGMQRLHESWTYQYTKFAIPRTLR